MIIVMLILFLSGYLLIAFEHILRLNKTAVALLLGIILWTLYIFSDPTGIIQSNPEAFREFIATNPELTKLSIQEQVKHFITDYEIIEHLGDISEILFYLLGAVLIVETIDKFRGFEIITRRITSQNKPQLLWIIAIISFFMSSVLDNMTSAIIMTLVVQKLLILTKERWLFCSIIIIAANAGGVWTPIGDVTTIMLWINDNITGGEIIKSTFLPSLISLLVPLTLTTFSLKGNHTPNNTISGQSTTAIANPYTKTESNTISNPNSDNISTSTSSFRNRIFIIGLCALVAVPIFKTLTTLPPFAGIMLSLGFFWIYTDWLTKPNSRQTPIQFSRFTPQTDLSTLLFFLGILMSVAALEAIGILHLLSQWLDQHIHNIYLLNLVIGLLSAIIDNVPLVAAAIGMYPLPSESLLQNSLEAGYALNFLKNGDFWNLLAYCAGTGGSLLIIGSAAGVVVMGMEKINFLWYIKQISWRALLGFLAGLMVYYLQHNLLSI